MDYSQADLELRAARDAATDRGDWQAARDIILAAGRDWELRTRRIAVLSIAASQSNGWLDAWNAAVPDDPVVAILRAEALMDQATRARGGAAAAHTSREQFKNFETLSAQASAATDRAIELNPEDPTPWSNLLATMLADGHRRGQEFADAFREGTGRDPYNFEIHLMALTFLCEKWYGSHERMFDAARKPAAEAPGGSSAAMLPLLAHFEYTLREYGWDLPSAATLTQKKSYFHRPEVIREIDACVAKWRSAGTPSLIGRGIVLRHWQALAYYLSDRRSEALAVVDEIGPYLGSVPAYGYFFPRQSEGFQAVWKFAHGIK
jgi:hypothetical protein